MTVVFYFAKEMPEKFLLSKTIERPNSFLKALLFHEKSKKFPVQSGLYMDYLVLKN